MKDNNDETECNVKPPIDPVQEMMDIKAADDIRRSGDPSDSNIKTLDGLLKSESDVTRVVAAGAVGEICQKDSDGNLPEGCIKTATKAGETLDEVMRRKR